MATPSIETLAPGFLIAAPALRDPNFERSVVLMCVQNDDGAMGLIINRPAPLTMGDLLSQLDLECSMDGSQTLLVGGPVATDSGLLLYRVPPGAAQRDDELAVGDELRLCPNRELLATIGLGRGPRIFHMFLGHAGWGPGQLESEISQGAWIPAPLQLELIFGTPFEKRWEEALRNEGAAAFQFAGRRPQA